MPRLALLLSCASVLLCATPAAALADDGAEPVSAPQPQGVRIVDGQEVRLAQHSDPASAIDEATVSGALARAELRAGPQEATLGTADGVLPETGCGVATSTDDTANATYPPSTKTIKVLYAYASDQANRFAQLQNRLQANASLLSRFLAEESGNRKTLRFDLGTSCGPQYLDIQTVALPNVKSYYVVGGAPNFTRVRNDVLAIVGSGKTHNWAVYADQLRGSNGVTGTAEYYYGASAEAQNSTVHDAGGLVAVVWGRTTPAGTLYADPTTMLHEIGHTLGAVQDGAPHSTGAGHCTDENDVMCYADGGPDNTITEPCPRLPGEIDSAFDCGGDDYFNATPAGGSWLATHWNTYRSIFMGSCTELADTCNADGAPIPPVNTTPTPTTTWQTATYAVTLTGSSSNGAVAAGQWQVDGGTVRDGLAATVAGDGVHTLRTRVQDDAAAWSDWRTDTVRIDTTAPAVVLTCPTTYSPGSTSCEANGTDATSGMARIDLREDGEVSVPTTGSRGTVAVTETGTTVVEARAVDVAGKASAWARADVRIDRSAPLLTVSCAAPSSGTTTCVVTGSDVGGSGLGTIGWTAGGVSGTVAAGGSFVVPAPASVAVSASDGAGNVGTGSTTVGAPPAVLTPAGPAPVATPPAGAATTPATAVPGTGAGATAAATGKRVLFKVRGSGVATTRATLTFATSTARVLAKLASPRMRLARGQYRVRLCLAEGRAAAVCVNRAVRLRAKGALPVTSYVRAVAAGRIVGRITVQRRSGSRWKTVATGSLATTTS